MFVLSVNVISVSTALCSSSYSYSIRMSFFLSVGNKNDDPSSKVVLTKDAQGVAQLMNMPLFETSAKENINVEEMFNAITRMVLKSKKDQLSKQSNDNAIKVTKSSGHKSRKKCC